MKSTSEKILCDHCAHNMIRNIAHGLNTFVCANCAEKWKIEGVIPIDRGQYAKRGLARRLLMLVRAADQSE